MAANERQWPQRAPDRWRLGKSWGYSRIEAFPAVDANCTESGMLAPESPHSNPCVAASSSSIAVSSNATSSVRPTFCLTDFKLVKEGAPTAGSACGLPAGSTAGPGSFVRDFFGKGCLARGAFRGVARGGSKGPLTPKGPSYPLAGFFLILGPGSRRCPGTQIFWDPLPRGDLPRAGTNCVFPQCVYHIGLKKKKKNSGCAGHLDHFGTRGGGGVGKHPATLPRGVLKRSLPPSPPRSPKPKDWACPKTTPWTQAIFGSSQPPVFGDLFYGV
jgi:hypothetical protein